MTTPLDQSLAEVFERAEKLSAALEKSEKPRQRKIIEILRKHGLPLFIAPFFDLNFRIAAQGGDTEPFSLLMITRLSAYLGMDAAIVAERHKAATADYIELMSGDLGRSDDAQKGEPFAMMDG